jgi:hypothetical protein
MDLSSSHDLAAGEEQGGRGWISCPGRRPPPPEMQKRRDACVHLHDDGRHPTASLYNGGALEWRASCGGGGSGLQGARRRPPAAPLHDGSELGLPATEGAPSRGGERQSARGAGR